MVEAASAEAASASADRITAAGAGLRLDWEAATPALELDDLPRPPQVVDLLPGGATLRG